MIAANTRTVVIDVAREQIRGPSGAAPAPDESGRTPQVEVTARLRSVLPAGSDDHLLLIAHPTGWGALRRTMIAEAARSLAGDVALAPRAVAIARSHVGATAGRVVVIEASADRVDAHTLRCVGAEWEVVKSAAGKADSAVSCGEIGDDIEAVLVDATDAERAREIVGMVERATVVGRVIVVDRNLLISFGAERRKTSPTITMTTPERRRQTARLVAPALVAAAVTAIAIVIGLVLFARNDHSAAGPAAATRSNEPPRFERADVGRTGLEVPAGWTRTTQPSADPALPRVTFADPGGDGRIIVVQFAVRDGANQQTVASSLRARIEHRGSDDVADFDEHRRVGGRDVISYRELPGSGQPVTWHVVVGDRLQVSVGCQVEAADMREACDHAVGSLTVAPR